MTWILFDAGKCRTQCPQPRRSPPWVRGGGKLEENGIVGTDDVQHVAFRVEGQCKFSDHWQRELNRSARFADMQRLTKRREPRRSPGSLTEDSSGGDCGGDGGAGD